MSYIEDICFFSMKDRNLFHRVDTIGNIFTSDAATSENITDGVHDMKQIKIYNEDGIIYHCHAFARQLSILLTELHVSDVRQRSKYPWIIRISSYITDSDYRSKSVDTGNIVH